MKKKLLLATIGSVIALSSCMTLAEQPHHAQNQRSEYREDNHQRKAYKIQHRIDEQERAIHNGIRKGSLTKHEARTLKHNIAKIKTEYQRAKNNDQYVSHKERERLDHMLDRNERMIRKLKGNGVERF